MVAVRYDKNTKLYTVALDEEHEELLHHLFDNSAYAMTNIMQKCIETGIVISATLLNIFQENPDG